MLTLLPPQARRPTKPGLPTKGANPMRSRVVALVIATTAVGLLATTGSATAGQGDTFCTWGGTPAAPTGVATFSPGVTNTPSTVPTYFVATGPLGGGAGCTGTLTFKGYAEPGNTCAVNRSEEHTSELQSRGHLVCRLLLETKKAERH